MIADRYAFGRHVTFVLCVSRGLNLCREQLCEYLCGVSISNRDIGRRMRGFRIRQSISICDTVSVERSGRSRQVMGFCTGSFEDGKTDGVTDAGVSRSQHQTCSAPQLLHPPHSIDLERHANQVYPEQSTNSRRRAGRQTGKWVLEGESPHNSRTSCLFLTR